MEAFHYRFEHLNNIHHFANDKEKQQLREANLISKGECEGRKAMSGVANIQEPGFTTYEDPQLPPDWRNVYVDNSSPTPNLKDEMKDAPKEGKEALAELERKLFGMQRSCHTEQRVTDSDHIPLRTGIPSLKFLKAGPRHIIDATDYEPLYQPQDNILEECLRREAERIAS